MNNNIKVNKVKETGRICAAPLYAAAGFRKDVALQTRVSAFFLGLATDVGSSVTS